MVNHNVDSEILHYSIDGDSDSLDDTWEINCTGNTTTLQFGAGNNDGDMLTNLEEQAFSSATLWPCNLHPLFPDTDSDGLFDSTESANGNIKTYERGLGDTDPILADTDSDGLNDEEEVNTYFTDPRNPDSDDDGGVFDGIEVNSDGTDPLNGKDDDIDGDGLGSSAEAAAGTDPEDSDSDNDGVADGIEVALGTDPLDSNSDEDNLSDFAEIYIPEMGIVTDHLRARMVTIIMAMMTTITVTAMITVTMDRHTMVVPMVMMTMTITAADMAER